MKFGRSLAYSASRELSPITTTVEITLPRSDSALRAPLHLQQNTSVRCSVRQFLASHHLPRKLEGSLLSTVSQVVQEVVQDKLELSMSDFFDVEGPEFLESCALAEPHVLLSFEAWRAVMSECTLRPIAVDLEIQLARNRKDLYDRQRKAIATLQLQQNEEMDSVVSSSKVDDVVQELVEKQRRELHDLTTKWNRDLEAFGVQQSEDYSSFINALATERLGGNRGNSGSTPQTLENVRGITQTTTMTNHESAECPKMEGPRSPAVLVQKLTFNGHRVVRLVVPFCTISTSSSSTSMTTSTSASATEVVTSTTIAPNTDNSTVTDPDGFSTPSTSNYSPDKDTSQRSPLPPRTSSSRSGDSTPEAIRSPQSSVLSNLAISGISLSALESEGNKSGILPESISKPLNSSTSSSSTSSSDTIGLNEVPVGTNVNLVPHGRSVTFDLFTCPVTFHFSETESVAKVQRMENAATLAAGESLSGCVVFLSSIDDLEDSITSFYQACYFSTELVFGSVLSQLAQAKDYNPRLNDSTLFATRHSNLQGYQVMIYCVYDPENPDQIFQNSPPTESVILKILLLCSQWKIQSLTFELSKVNSSRTQLILTTLLDALVLDRQGHDFLQLCQYQSQKQLAAAVSSQGPGNSLCSLSSTGGFLFSGARAAIPSFTFLSLMSELGERSDFAGSIQDHLLNLDCSRVKLPQPVESIKLHLASVETRKEAVRLLRQQRLTV